MSELRITPLGRAEAQAITAWRYPPPYDSYNLGGDPAAAALFLTHRERGYFQICDAAGELLAFCCYGAEAQVPGGDYSRPALDLGLGVRPDLTGLGQGRRYLDAVTAYGEAHFAPPALRLSVAAFNARAIRLYAGAGFGEARRFTSTYGGGSFIIMTRRVGCVCSGNNPYDNHSNSG